METYGTVKTIFEGFFGAFLQPPAKRGSMFPYISPKTVMADSKESGGTRDDAVKFDKAQAKAVLESVEGVKTIQAERPAFDKTLAVPPPLLPEENSDVSDEGDEIFDRIPAIMDKVKRSRESVKSFYQSLSNIAGAFEYKENRTDEETRFLHEVLSGRIRITGDLNRKSVTSDEAEMPVLERIDKAEWLVENGAPKYAEKELVTVEQQIALIEERIRIAYSSIAPKR